MKIPDASHPITITPNPSRVRVEVGGRTIANTTRALALQESTYPAVQYVPLEDVDTSVLTPIDRRTSCPYKGECSYWSVTVPGASAEELARGEGAVWGYVQPYDAVGAIAGHVAFYADRLDVIVEPAGDA